MYSIREGSAENGGRSVFSQNRIWKSEIPGGTKRVGEQGEKGKKVFQWLRG